MVGGCRCGGSLGRRLGLSGGGGGVEYCDRETDDMVPAAADALEKHMLSGKPLLRDGVIGRRSGRIPPRSPSSLNLERFAGGNDSVRSLSLDSVFSS